MSLEAIRFSGNWQPKTTKIGQAAFSYRRNPNSFFSETHGGPKKTAEKTAVLLLNVLDDLLINRLQDHF